jgi:hypothetical protein
MQLLVAQSPINLILGCDFLTKINAELRFGRQSVAPVVILTSNPLEEKISFMDDGSAEEVKVTVET